MYIYKLFFGDIVRQSLAQFFAFVCKFPCSADFSECSLDAVKYMKQYLLAYKSKLLPKVNVTKYIPFDMVRAWFCLCTYIYLYTTYLHIHIHTYKLYIYIYEGFDKIIHTYFSLVQKPDTFAVRMLVPSHR